MARSHLPALYRASLQPGWSQADRAIDSPKPLLNLESKRLRGPDAPGPKPVRDPLRELAVFWAQFNSLVERISAPVVALNQWTELISRISAAMAPVVAFSQRFESMKRQLVLGPLTRQN